jgi:MFS transporter, MCT family, solute carrier family 16 (monocarboxylic acid transporters), member 10
MFLTLPRRFCTGAFVALVSIPIMGMGDASDVGRRLGTVFTVVSIGALTGPPISGAINTATGGFRATGYCAGNVVFVI